MDDSGTSTNESQQRNRGNRDRGRPRTTMQVMMTTAVVPQGLNLAGLDIGSMIQQSMGGRGPQPVMLSMSMDGTGLGALGGMLGGIGGSDAAFDQLITQILNSYQPAERPTAASVRSSLPRLQVRPQDDTAGAVSSSESSQSMQQKGNQPATETDGSSVSRQGYASCKPGEPCSVCHETFQSGETVVELPCSHGFHEPCLMPWLETHNTCPLCRHILQEEEDTPSASRRHRQHNTAPQYTDEDQELEAAAGFRTGQHDTPGRPAGIRALGSGLREDPLFFDRTRAMNLLTRLNNSSDPWTQASMRADGNPATPSNGRDRGTHITGRDRPTGALNLSPMFHNLVPHAAPGRPTAGSATHSDEDEETESASERGEETASETDVSTEAEGSEGTEDEEEEEDSQSEPTDQPDFDIEDEIAQLFDGLTDQLRSRIAGIQAQTQPRQTRDASQQQSAANMANRPSEGRTATNDMSGSSLPFPGLPRGLPVPTQLPVFSFPTYPSYPFLGDNVMLTSQPLNPHWEQQDAAQSIRNSVNAVSAATIIPPLPQTSQPPIPANNASATPTLAAESAAASSSQPNTTSTATPAASSHRPSTNQGQTATISSWQGASQPPGRPAGHLVLEGPIAARVHTTGVGGAPLPPPFPFPVGVHAGIPVSTVSGQDGSHTASTPTSDLQGVETSITPFPGGVLVRRSVMLSPNSAANNNSSDTAPSTATAPATANIQHNSSTNTAADAASAVSVTQTPEGSLRFVFNGPSDDVQIRIIRPGGEQPQDRSGGVSSNNNSRGNGAVTGRDDRSSNNSSSLARGFLTRGSSLSASQNSNAGSTSQRPSSRPSSSSGAQGTSLARGFLSSSRNSPTNKNEKESTDTTVSGSKVNTEGDVGSDPDQEHVKKKQRSSMDPSSVPMADSYNDSSGKPESGKSAGTPSKSADNAVEIEHVAASAVDQDVFKLLNGSANVEAGVQQVSQPASCSGTPSASAKRPRGSLGSNTAGKSDERDRHASNYISAAATLDNTGGPANAIAASSRQASGSGAAQAVLQLPTDLDSGVVQEALVMLQRVASGDAHIEAAVNDAVDSIRNSSTNNHHSPARNQEVESSPLSLLLDSLTALSSATRTSSEPVTSPVAALASALPPLTGQLPALQAPPPGTHLSVPGIRLPIGENAVGVLETMVRPIETTVMMPATGVPMPRDTVASWMGALDGDVADRVETAAQDDHQFEDHSEVRAAHRHNVRRPGAVRRQISNSRNRQQQQQSAVGAVAGVITAPVRWLLGGLRRPGANRG